MTNYLWNHKLIIISSIIIVVNTYIYTYIYNNNNNKMCFSSSNLRLVTYNVHRFDMHGQNTVQKIKSHLSSLRPVPHIIALNEVNVVEKPKALDMIAEELNMKYEFFGHVGEGRYGNALFTSLPIKQKKEIHLRGGTEVQFPAGTKKLNGDIAKAGEKHRIARGMLVVDMENGMRNLRCGVTHLDHMSMKERQVQLKHIVEELIPKDIESEKNTDIILLGDLNALTRSDYNDEDWKRIEDTAEKNGWSPPEPDLDLNILKKNNFFDALAMADYPPDRPWRTASTDNPMYRIDYCFIRSKYMGVDQSLILSHTKESSDHFPVLFDVEQSVPDAETVSSSSSSGSSDGKGINFGISNL